MDREKLIKDIERQISEPTNEFVVLWFSEAGYVLELLKEQDEEHRRLLFWLGKFCRHIDNGDAWLTDEENIAFFKEKMKQQFGWNTD
ncbi:MAG: hypothetical protein J6U01_00965 [Clostridia bacterium]|nr:hypothetical protein [Clostridia bacterium]